MKHVTPNQGLVRADILGAELERMAGEREHEASRISTGSTGDVARRRKLEADAAILRLATVELMR